MRKPFLSYFRTMKDHRINRKKRHPLENIIAITIVAVICNSDTWEDVAFFGEMKKDFFSKFLDLSNGIPSKDTFRRFFAALDPEVFESHFLQWAQSLAKNIDQEIVSIDGKTIRQASRMQSDNPIHLVSAWASHNELILGQLKTEEKSNEITAIPHLLESLFLEGATVTIDAMGCQKSIVNQIVIEKKADYVLALKENHPTLLEEVTQSFKEKPCHEFYQTLDYGHGRIEERKCSIINDLGFIFDKASWTNLRSIVRIDSQRIIKKTGEIQQETRYYISSLTDAEKTSKAIRCHWGVENKVHWCLDMTFGEDSSSKRAGFSSQNFSLINKIALNLIRKNIDKDIESKRFKKWTSIKSRRRLAHFCDDYLLELLNLI